MLSIKQKPRLSKKRREAKELEWKRMARRQKPGIKVPRDQIARLDAETLAIDHTRIEEAMKLLRESGIKFWEMGPLYEVCCRVEHSNDWMEG